MMGRLMFMMKRWWLIAVVFTLALSLTSCSSRSNYDGLNYGYSECNGAVGEFDIYTIANGGTSSSFNVVVVPYQVYAQGVSLTFGLENSYTGFPALQDVTPVRDQEILVKTLTTAELQNYTNVRIGPYQAGTPYLSSSADNDILCELPLPPSMTNQQSY